MSEIAERSSWTLLKSRPGKNLRRLRVEQLEVRRLLAVATVDTERDVMDAADGLTSLREAILAANSLPGADEIVFDFGHDGPARIVLEHGELEITEALTLTGDGPDLLTIDAQGNSRIFNITAESGDYAIQGMTLTGGSSEGPGGAIFAQGGNLTILSSTITGNSTSGDGGGILSGGNVTVASSVVADNSARKYGGGISADGNVTLTSSSVSNNSATGDDGGFGGGGGIYAVGDVTVNFSSILENSVSGDGGGISAFGTVMVASSTVSGNSGLSGGGIDARLGVTVTSSTISENSAHNYHNSGQGGGINSGNVTVSGSTISGNMAARQGGGISAGVAIVTSSTISGNSTSFHGGGIHASGEVTVASTTIWGNSASLEGGGIYIDGTRYVRVEGPDPDVTTLHRIQVPLVVTVRNSIVAGNAGGPAQDVQPGIGPLAFVNSLIGDNSGSSLLEAPVGAPDVYGNLIGGSDYGVIDPQLGPLKDNGGPTETHALLADSPAIDAIYPFGSAGENGIPLYDQRGAPYTRIVGGRIDIGAFEVQTTLVASADFDGNGVVDGADALAWQRGLGTVAASKSDGDADNDADVDSDDLGLVIGQYGQPAPSMTVSNVSINEQPAALVQVEDPFAAAAPLNAILDENLVDAALALQLLESSADEPAAEIPVEQREVRHFSRRAALRAPLPLSTKVTSVESITSSKQEDDTSEHTQPSDRRLEKVFSSQSRHFARVASRRQLQQGQSST